MTDQPETPELRAARQRLAGIQQLEREVADHRSNAEAQKAEAQQAIEAAEQEIADAQQLARTSGKPFDIALQEIRTARGTVPSDALQMTREQYLRHRESHGIY